MDYTILADVDLPKIALADHYDAAVTNEDGVPNLTTLPELAELLKDAEYLTAVAPYLLNTECVYSILCATGNPDDDATLLEERIATLTEAFGDDVRIMVRDTLTVYDIVPNQNVTRRRDLVRHKVPILELRFWITN